MSALDVSWARCYRLGVMRPKTLTSAQIEMGGLSTWAEQYATWMASLPSFAKGYGTNRASMGRIRAIRACQASVDRMLPALSMEQRDQLVMDIRDTAKLIARANAEFFL